MGRDAPIILFIFLCSLLATFILLRPEYLSDDGNKFLRDFLDNDILSVLGFITAVGNAATLSIFLHLNSLEDEVKFKANRSKKSLKKSAISLVYAFLIAFFAVTIKHPISNSPHWTAFINSIGVACVFFSLSVLRDLTLFVFGIPTKTKILEIQKKNQENSS